MSTKPAKAPEKRKTPDLLLDAAESLFGDRGIEAVSLREIGLAAGCSNKFAVQYHFSDKAGLIEQIFRRRLPKLDARRAILMRVLEATGRVDNLRSLMDALLRPLAEQADEDGLHRYASFLDGLHRFPTIAHLRARNADLSPETERIRKLIRERCLHIPEQYYETRANMAIFFFVKMIADYDRGKFDDEVVHPPYEVFVDDAINIATAALRMPMPL